MKNKISYLRLDKNYHKIKKKLFFFLDRIGNKGDFILAKEVGIFENKLKKFLNSKYVASCANGTDAIEISLKILGIKKNDEVITVANTWISVANSIINIGAKPKFIDIDESLNMNILDFEKVISKKTKCIIVTHLNGLPCKMATIIKICKKYNIKIIEDCSQAIGSKYKGSYVGNFGDIATFSLHPTKNLGVFGDGGFISTNNKRYYNKFITIRNNGLINRDNAKYIGRNSRLDAIQAIVGLLQLKNLKKCISSRKGNAKFYNKSFASLKNFIKTPNFSIDKDVKHTFHRYVIICSERNKLFKYLIKNNIEVKIHYPLNIHEQISFKDYYTKKLINTDLLNKKIISLPIHENLTLRDLRKIIKLIKNFYKKKIFS
jgi:aminotransferase EvaB